MHYMQNKQIKMNGCLSEYTISFRISVSQMTTDMFHLSQTLPGPFIIHDLSPSSFLDELDGCH